jgi:hypothetical protein
MFGHYASDKMAVSPRQPHLGPPALADRRHTITLADRKETEHWPADTAIFSRIAHELGSHHDV